MNTTEIIRKYTSGHASLVETNEALREVGAIFHLDPQKNYISPAEVDLYGLLETGTGSMEKVRVRDLKLNHQVNEVQPDGTVNMVARVHFAGKVYAVHGDQLVEVE